MKSSFLAAAFLLPQVVNGEDAQKTNLHPADRHPPEKTMALYYTTDWTTCHDFQTTKLPVGLTDSGNAFMLSFISCRNQLCTDPKATDGWYEDTNGLGATCELIKAKNPGAYVAYTVGGLNGSGSKNLQDYFTSTSAHDIAERILNWECADGVDFDFENGFLDLPGFVQKIVDVSKIVKKGGKSITFASYGSLALSDRSAPVKALLKEDPDLVSMWGVMWYPGEDCAGSEADPGICKGDNAAGQGPMDGCGMPAGQKCTLQTAKTGQSKCNPGAIHGPTACFKNFPSKFW